MSSDISSELKGEILSTFTRRLYCFTGYDPTKLSSNTGGSFFSIAFTWQSFCRAPQYSTILREKRETVNSVLPCHRALACTRNAGNVGVQRTEYAGLGACGVSPLTIPPAGRQRRRTTHTIEVNAKKALTVPQSARLFKKRGTYRDFLGGRR